MNLIEFSCDLSQAHKEYLTNILPRRKTKVVEVIESANSLLRVKLFTDCIDVETIKSWLKEYQEITKATYSIRSSGNTAGRKVVFKQVLNCHHNTHSKKLYSISNKTNTKNTNCPATINITLHSIKKRYQGKYQETYLLRKDLPCEIYMTVTHNHSTENAFALKFRRVATDVKERLLQLFRDGHSPSTALEIIKTDIYLRSDNPELDLADRSQCPDYWFCHRLYMKQLKENHEPKEPNTTVEESLKMKLDEYNMQTDGNSAQIIFGDSEFVICICTPLMKRVHRYIRSSSEIVFVDSTSTVDNDGNRIFIILTDGHCGGLPLAVIITSSDSCDILKIGFQMLNNMLGEEIFGGNPEGPETFITDDCPLLQTAMSDIWTRSKCLLCTFHVLQAVWGWLVDAENRIPHDQQLTYYEDFKSILYARTIDHCFKQYEISKSYAERHSNYVSYLESYWHRKEQWALAYRNKPEINTSTFTETVMKVVKEKIFIRAKAFNVFQTVDFILTKFVHYYETRLLDAVNNRLRKNILGKSVKIPSGNLLQRIEVLADDTVIVPSEMQEDLHFITDVNALMCSCFRCNTKRLCKHLDWACILLYSEKYNTIINNHDVKHIFEIVATGNDPIINDCGIKDLFEIVVTSSDIPADSHSPILDENQKFMIIDEVIPTCSSNLSPPSVQIMRDSACVDIKADPSNDETMGYPPDVEIEEDPPDVEIEQNPPKVEINEELCEQYLIRGQTAIEKLGRVLTQFLEKNPTRDAAVGLEKMCKNAERLRTPAAFLSSLSNFALGYRRKIKRSFFPPQLKATGRRKFYFQERTTFVGKQLRKESYFRKFNAT